MPRVYCIVLKNSFKIPGFVHLGNFVTLSKRFFKINLRPTCQRRVAFLPNVCLLTYFVSMQDLHSPNRSLPLTLVGKTRIKSPFGANTLQVVHKKKDSRNFRYYMRVSIRYFPSLVYERIKGRDVIVFNSCIFFCLCKQMKGLCSSTKECIPRYIQLEIASLDSVF